MFKFKLTESKEDVQKFIDKFGQDTYDEFKKSSQRLKNNNMSTDIYAYINDDSMDKKKLDTILFNLKQKVSAKDNDITKIQGRYEYIGQGNGYKVYKPLDAVASMNLGVGTGWCTTGRYGHYGEDNFKPSLSDAEKHFNDYTKNGFEFYYFLDSKTMKGLYAAAYNPVTGDLQIFDAGDYEVGKIPNIPKLKKLPSVLLSGLVIDSGIIIKCVSYDKHIEIPDSVTRIGKNAFYGCESLKSVTIPDSVTSIAWSAFGECTNLTSITIPNSVTYIGDYALIDCTSLTSITIPDSVTHIGEGVFRNCTSLTSITIPDSVTDISGDAFGYCTSLTSITIPDSVTSIGGSAFRYCTSLTSIAIPDSVTSMGGGAFFNCTNLKNITIPNGVTSIGRYAFYGCESLKNITIPNGVTSICNDAFSNCDKLTSVTIPDSVTRIGDRVFYNCYSLTSVTIGNGVTSIGEYAFSGCENLTLQVYAGSYAEEYAKEKEIPYKIIDGIKENFTFRLVERFDNNSRNRKKLPDIEKADLLTLKEARKLPKLLLQHYNSWWWLNSPTKDENNVDVSAYVNTNGHIEDFDGYCVFYNAGAVRPALRISNLNDYKVGEDFKFGGKWFRIIDEHTALCLDDIGQHRFDKESNNYETSEIKRFIDDWFNKAKSKLKEGVENKMNFRFKLVEDLRESSDGDIRDVFDKLIDYCYDVHLDFPDVDKFYNRVTFYARYKFDKSIPVYVGINENGKIYAFIDNDVFNKKEFRDAYQLSDYIISVAKSRHELSEDYDEEKVAIANRTSRTSGASAINKDGTIRSVVGRYVLDNIDKKSSILDFGAGKDAVQTQALRQNGFENVTAYDFGVNVKNGVHDPNALNKKYDVVFASNVLNVSSDEDMLRETLRDINKAAAKTIIFNYPSSPRKAGLTTKEVENIIVDEYGIKPTVVVGPKSSPVWRIEK